MIRKLVIAALVVSVVPAALLAGAPAFVGAEKCKPCHIPEFGTWSASAHAAATETAKAGEGFSAACLRCHATNSSEALPNVQCEACHGPGSEYWPVPVMMDREKAVALGLLIQQQSLCDSCHDGADHHARVELGKFKHDHREKKGAVDLQ